MKDLIIHLLRRPDLNWDPRDVLHDLGIRTTGVDQPLKIKMVESTHEVDSEISVRKIFLSAFKEENDRRVTLLGSDADQFLDEFGEFIDLI